MIKLQRLGHILVAVRDLERSIDFYTRILGFKLLERDPEHGGAFLSIGGYGNTLDLFQSTTPEIDIGEFPKLSTLSGLGVKHTAFAVAEEAELAAAHQHLKDAGVPIHIALDHDSQKSVYFHDPDGNLLEIVWEHPQALEKFAAGRVDDHAELSFDK